MRAELIIVGAGPAGMAAGIEARRLGLDPLILDEDTGIGGQIYRQFPPEFSVDAKSFDRGQSRGVALRRAAEAAGAIVRSETLVWGISPALHVQVASSRGLETIAGQRVIVAAGAYDRAVPFPGWTLPGVFTVGAVQRLLKSQRLLVGRRVLLAGTGPLLLVVASQLAAAGVEVLIADPVPRRAVLRRLPGLMADWGLMRDGALLHLELLRHHAHWLSSSVLTSVHGKDRVQGATVARADSAWRPIPATESTFDVDAVALGYGLLPSTELARLAGCELQYDQLADAWVPVLDNEFSTTVAGISAVGDGAGVAGATVAVDQGRIAAVAAARDLGYITTTAARKLQDSLQKRLRRRRRFRTALDALYSPQAGLYELAAPETVVCRCEEVTCAEVDAALASGIDRIELLKLHTRVSMGACQGRMCMPWLLQRLECATGWGRGTAVLPRARPPVRPLPLTSLDCSAMPGDAP